MFNVLNAAGSFQRIHAVPPARRLSNPVVADEMKVKLVELNFDVGGFDTLWGGRCPTCVDRDLSLVSGRAIEPTPQHGEVRAGKRLCSYVHSSNRRKKLTITIAKPVHDGLFGRIGKRRISQFIERLVRRATSEIIREE